MKDLKTHPLVEHYLRQATQGLPKKSVRDDIQEELLCHIEADVALLMAQENLSLDQAVQRTIDELGSAATVCGSFFKVYHRSRYLLLKLSSAMAAIVAAYGLFYIGSALNEAREKQEKYVASVRPYVDDYLNDVADLGRTDAFDEIRTGKDAGEYLNPRVEWAISKDNPHFHQVKGIEKIPLSDFSLYTTHSNVPYTRQISQVYGAYADKWYRYFDFKNLNDFQKEALEDLKVDWMKDLLRYDYWDLHSSGPYSHPTDGEATAWNGSPSETPIPYLNSFVLFADVRLLRGLRDGDPLAALTEVHHLAKLLYTTETMAGIKAALDIYDLEELFYKHVVKNGRLAAKDFTPVPEALIFKAGRVFDATSVFLNYNMARETDVFRKIFGGGKLPPGTCAAYMQATNMARMKRKTWYMLDGSSDPDYAHNNDELFSRLKSTCRLTYFRENLTASEWAAGLRAEEIPKHEFIKDVKEQNWGIWSYWYVMKYALEIPHVRNTYTRYMASTADYPYFPTEYKDWDKFSKNLKDHDNSH